MKLEIFSREGRTLVQGIVVEKRAGTGAAAGKLKVMFIMQQQEQKKKRKWKSHFGMAIKIN